MEGASTDLELFDQGKQSKFVHVPEWYGPDQFLAPQQRTSWSDSDEGVIKMGNGDNVPRVTCQGAREETMRIVGKVNYDQFDNFQGKPGGWG
jgi:hypothetical protein